MPYELLPRIHRTPVAVAMVCLLLGGLVAGFANAQGCAVATIHADRALLEAAEYSEFGAFRKALKEGGDVNARDSECNTSLIWAARSLNQAIAGELLSLEINFAAKNNVGKTALDYATDRQNAEMQAQIEAAIRAFDHNIGQLTSTGKLDEVLAIFDRRTLDPDYEVNNLDRQAFGDIYFGRRTAIMLATVGAPTEADLVPFIEKMIERGATLGRNWPGETLADAAIVGKRLDVLSFALTHGNSASADMAQRTASSGADWFAVPAIKVLLAARDPATPLVPWLEAVVKFPDPKNGVQALRLLVSEGVTLADVGSALIDASGAELQFLLAHGASVAKDDPLIPRILGIDSYGVDRVSAVDLDLLELALDRGVRADVPVRDYGPQPDIIAVMLDNLYRSEKAGNSINAVQLGRVLEKLTKAGASLNPQDYNKRWPSPVEQVLNATTHREILSDVLANLDELGAEPPRLCWYIGKSDLAIVVRLMEFRNSSESGGDAYRCAGEIGREKAGTPKERQDLYRALAEHAVVGREEAIENELSRISRGGGDPESIAALRSVED